MKRFIAILLLGSVLSAQSAGITTPYIDANGNLLPAAFGASGVHVLNLPAGTLINGSVPNGTIALHHLDGTSTTYSPTAATNAARGVALSAAVTAHVAGERIDVGPGTYQVAAKLTIKSGVQFIGHASTIKLADQGTNGGYHIVFASTLLTGTIVDGFTFDCNLAAQTETTAYVGAVQLYGTNNQIRNCRAINWGNKGSGGECFVFVIGNDPTTGVIGYGNKITGCTVDTPAQVTHSAGATALMITGQGLTGGALTTVGNGWQIDPEISGNVIHDVTVGTGTGQPQAFHAISTSGSGGQVFANSVYNILSASGIDDAAAYYLDTWAQYDLVIHSNTFRNCTYGVRLTPSGFTETNWVIRDNFFTCQRAISVSGADGGSTVSGLTIKGNNFYPFVDSGIAVRLTSVSDADIFDNIDKTSAIYSDGGGNSSIRVAPKVYRAILNQSGTSAPVATVMENSLGGTLVWTRASLGNYVGTLSGVFTATKTWLMCHANDNDNGNGDAQADLVFTRSSNNAVGIDITDGVDHAEFGALVQDLSVEIRVYP